MNFTDNLREPIVPAPSEDTEPVQGKRTVNKKAKAKARAHRKAVRAQKRHARV